MEKEKSKITLTLLIDPILIKRAMDKLIQETGTGGFVLVFGLGFEYGRIIADMRIKNSNNVSEGINILKEYLNVEFKYKRFSHTVYVKAKDPLVNGFICGVLTKFYRGYKIEYLDNETIIRFSREPIQTY